MQKNIVTKILSKSGPTTTSEVAKVLRQSGLSPDAARQRVSRLPKNVRVLYGLPFPKGSRFIYLDSQFATDNYWTCLIRAVKTSNPACATALAGMQGRGGAVLRRHFRDCFGITLKTKRPTGKLSGTCSLAVSPTDYQHKD